MAIPIAPGPGAVRPLKTSERVARDIVHDIAVQRLQPGDALPAEADMIGQYGVSRESLREALRLLEVQGLIAIRRGPGGGPTVGTVDPANLAGSPRCTSNWPAAPTASCSRSGSIPSAAWPSAPPAIPTPRCEPPA